MEYLSKEEEKPESGVTTPKVITPQMSKEAWLILQHFSEHPFINITKRGKSLKMSARKFDDAKQELIRAELVEEANITWGDGDPKTYIVPHRQRVEFTGVARLRCPLLVSHSLSRI